MRRFYVIFILMFTFLFFGCVSSMTNIVPENTTNIEEKVPKWISDQGRLELFPAQQFVSQIAYGNTPQESKDKAAANISEYIKSSIISSTTSSYFYSENNDSYLQTKEIKADVQILTSNDLYKIEYTNPYYYSDLGQYVCVAFINREQAFNFVKPKLEIAKNQFPLVYYDALRKDSLLDKIIGIKNAQKILPDFYEVYDFARAILPEKAKIFEQVDALANESFIKERELSNSVLIKIEAVGNADLIEKSGVVAELTSQFKKLGFIVGNSLKYNCIALVEAKSTITETKSTYETYPELYVKVLEKGAEKISYSKKLSKVAGFDKDTVIRRTNLALTNEIKTSFIDECF